MELKPGSRWRSAVCETEIAVIRPPKAACTLECGGYAMISLTEDKPSGIALKAEFSQGTQAGKRYFDEASGIEVLCTKAGQGSVALAGVILPIKEAKPLPSSD